MSVKTSAFSTIDVTPGDMKDVVDAQCGVQTDQDYGVFPEFRLFGKIVVDVIMLKLFAADRLCCAHSGLLEMINEFGKCNIP